MLQPVVMIVAVVGQAAPDPSATVRRLGSSDVDEQRAAAAALLAAGRDAMPALMAAREADAAGLRSRALELCTRVEGDSVGRATRVRLELRDAPIGRAIDALAEAMGQKVAPSRSDARDRGADRRRITLATPGEIPFWEALESLRRAGGLELLTMGPPLELGLAKPGSESGPVSISGPFRGQLLGIRRERRLELGKATRGIERYSRAVPARSGDLDPRIGPARETFVARLWILPEPGARMLFDLPIEQKGPLERDLPPGPGLKYRPGWAATATRAEDEQGRSLRPTGPPTSGTLGCSNRCTEYLAEVPLSMPDPPGRRLAHLEISVPFSFAEERQDPIDVRLAGASGRSFRGSGATLTIAAAGRANPPTMEVTVTPDPPLRSVADLIRNRPGQVQFFDDKETLLRPTVTETPFFFGGKRLAVRFQPGESPATLHYAGIVQRDTAAVFRFDGIPLP